MLSSLVSGRRGRQEASELPLGLGSFSRTQTKVPSWREARTTQALRSCLAFFFSLVIFPTCFPPFSGHPTSRVTSLLPLHLPSSSPSPGPVDMPPGSQAPSVWEPHRRGQVWRSLTCPAALPGPGLHVGEAGQVTASRSAAAPRSAAANSKLPFLSPICLCLQTPKGTNQKAK